MRAQLDPRADLLYSILTEVMRTRNVPRGADEDEVIWLIACFVRVAKPGIRLESVHAEDAYAEFLVSY